MNQKMTKIHPKQMDPRKNWARKRFTLKKRRTGENELKFNAFLEEPSLVMVA